MPELEAEKSKKFFTPFIVANVVVFVIVVASNFYFFYFKKNYDFLIEVPCDPTKEECIERDCSVPDSCPPNELSLFKRYSLKASDFKFCPNEDCALVCESGEIECIQEECVEDLEMGESCIYPSEFVDKENILELDQ